MTDLERLLTILDRNGMWEVADVVRPHLKEDVAREDEHWKRYHDLAESKDAELAALREAVREVTADRDRLRATVVLAQDVVLAWGDGNNDKMQAALLGLFLRIYGQAPRQLIGEKP